jgi:hypothetical protein
MLSVILLLMLPAPAAVLLQVMALPAQTGNPANVVLIVPKSTKRYSNFTLQLPPTAHSAPPPAVQPVLVTPLPLKFQIGQSDPAGQGRDPGTKGLRNPVDDAKLSTVTRP